MIDTTIDGVWWKHQPDVDRRPVENLSFVQNWGFQLVDLLTLSVDQTELFYWSTVDAHQRPSTSFLLTFSSRPNWWVAKLKGAIPIMIVRKLGLHR